MPRTEAGPQPRVPDRNETADLCVAICPGSPLVVEIRGEIDIQSAPGLRDELLRVIRRCGPQLDLDLASVTFMDCAGLNVLLATRRRALLEQGSAAGRPGLAAGPADDLTARPGAGIRARVTTSRPGPGIGGSYGTIAGRPWSPAEPSG